MRIKNDYIIIKNGKKETKIHNTILNIYLDHIIANQMELNPNNRKSLRLDYVYLKFDDELVFDKTSILNESDFDVRGEFYIYDYDISDTNIILDYSYKFQASYFDIYDINQDDWIQSLSAYVGKKITAIGFAGGDVENKTIYACVNTSGFGLYVEAPDEVFSVARRDIITTDTIFYCPTNLVDGAVHLFDGQYTYFPNTFWAEFQLIGILDAIGVGILPIHMDITQTLLPYSSHITTNNQTIDISDEFEIEYSSEGLFPALDVYPATTLYPERVISELYPSEDIYPRN